MAVLRNRSRGTWLRALVPGRNPPKLALVFKLDLEVTLSWLLHWECGWKMASGERFFSFLSLLFFSYLRALSKIYEEHFYSYNSPSPLPPFLFTCYQQNGQWIGSFSLSTQTLLIPRNLYSLISFWVSAVCVSFPPLSALIPFYLLLANRASIFVNSHSQLPHRNVAGSLKPITCNLA